MRNPFVHRVGGVLSADIAVPEHERELAFYSKILTTGDVPLWREDLTNNLGTPVIGLGVRTSEYDSLPLQWMPHFQVADVAASAACTNDMGGKVLMQSGTGAGECQWAVLVDPVGAAFGVVSVVPDESDSAAQNARFGCISWLSLIVPDALPIRDFYQTVVGWQAGSNDTEKRAGDAARFEMQIDDDIAAAEIRQNCGESEGIPPVWLIHLPVADLTESLQRVREGGGKVIHEDADAKHAIIRDPVGVCFALQNGGSADVRHAS